MSLYIHPISDFTRWLPSTVPCFAVTSSSFRHMVSANANIPMYEGRALIKCTRLLDWLFPIEYLIFRGHMKALNILFHLKCDSLFNSDKWLYGSPKCWATLLNPSPTRVKTVSKTTVLWVAGNKECLYILTCHLVISQSSASYHTSFERGKSGLFADKKKSLLSNK